MPDPEISFPGRQAEDPAVLLVRAIQHCIDKVSGLWPTEFPRESAVLVEAHLLNARQIVETVIATQDQAPTEATTTE